MKHQICKYKNTGLDTINIILVTTVKTLLSTGSCFHTKDEAGEEPWWAVDLGHDIFVHRVRIYNRISKGEHSAKYFTI